MKAIDRKLLFHLVDIVWGDAFEDESVPSTEHARELIQKAIERRRGEKYSKEKLYLPDVRYTCVHSFIKTDMYWKSCRHCGEIRPLFQGDY